MSSACENVVTTRLVIRGVFWVSFVIRCSVSLPLEIPVDAYFPGSTKPNDKFIFTYSHEWPDNTPVYECLDRDAFNLLKTEIK